VILQRIFAVLSALLLVAAVALATLGPSAVPLGGLLGMVDQDLAETLREGINQHISTWIWPNLIVPLLVRPAWLIPASLGLITAGIALSLPKRKSANRTHRRSQR
jgi:hypothetical protein